MVPIGGDEQAVEVSFWPKRTLDRTLAALCVGILTVCLGLLFTFPFGRDQGIFAVIGEGLLHGQVPYRDLWDVKTPGIFFVFAFAEAIFGHTMVGPRIVESVAVIVTALTFIDLSRQWFRDVVVGYIAALIFGILEVQLDFWHTSQPETYGGMLLVWASWLMFGTWPKREGVRQGLGGALLGAALLMKPHLGLAFPVLFGGLFFQTSGSKTKAVAQLLRSFAGIVLVVGACAVWIATSGALKIAIWTWRDFAPGYSALGTPFTFGSFYGGLYSTSVTLFAQLTALGSVGLILALSLGPSKPLERRAFWWLVGQAVCLGLAVLIQHKSFKYHYAAAFPVLALAAAVGWGKLWRVATGHGWRYAWVFLIAFGAAYFMRFPVTDLSGTFHERTWVRIVRMFGGRPVDENASLVRDFDVVRKDFDLGNVRAVASWLRREVEANETVLVWGCDAIIYWLAERRPATRFIHNIPQRSPWQADKARRRFMEEIKRSQPRAVVVQHGDVIQPVTGEREDSAGTIRLFPEFSEYLRKGFKRELTIGKFDVYVR